MTENDIRIREIIEAHGKKATSLLPVLMEAQSECGDLSIEVQKKVAKEMNLPLPRVAGVATFYPAFEYNLVTKDGLPLRKTGPILSQGKYVSLNRALQNVDGILPVVKASGLSGRGGSRFPVAAKWEISRLAEADEKFVVCNGSEGEKDTYKDRSLMLHAPHAIIEGMVLCAAAVGAKTGYIYINAEYLDAQEAMGKAIKEAYDAGFLGKNILGSQIDFDLEVYSGAGAYVSGEETALLEYIQGNRGEPRLKPPYPGNAGLFGKPTVINNAESFASVPLAVMGKPCNTRLFTVAGSVKMPGVYELPLDSTPRQLVDAAGGGEIKGFRLGGGTTGSFFASNQLDIKLDEPNIAVGPGSLYIFDNETDVPKLAAGSLRLLAEHSCGKCTPCRFGVKQMLEKLESLISGTADKSVIAELESLCSYVKQSARCGLGQAAPNVLLTALDAFRDEFEEALK